MSEYTSDKQEYWGGIFDIGICPNIVKQKATPNNRLKEDRYYPKLYLFDNREDVITSICQQFFAHNRPMNGNCKYSEIHAFVLSSTIDIRRFFEIVSPWLRLKSAPLSVMSEFVRVKEYCEEKTECKNDCTANCVECEGSSPWYRQKLIAAEVSSYKTLLLPSSPRLAGILDFAGGMGLYQREKSECPVSSITITSPYIGLLECLHQQYKGSRIDPGRSHTSRYHGQPTHLWSISGANSKAVFEDIYPYLVFRKEIAKIIMDYLDGKATANSLPNLPPMKGIKGRLHSSFL